VDVAVGLGIRADLPIGPVRLEYGHNMTRDNGEPTGAFHFAIGVSF
jgi:outer membrane protein assembly factor BamA